MGTVNIFTLMVYAILVGIGFGACLIVERRRRAQPPAAPPPPARPAPAPEPAAAPMPMVIPLAPPSAQELLSQRVLALEQMRVQPVKRPPPRPRARAAAR